MNYTHKVANNSDKMELTQKEMRAILNAINPVHCAVAGLKILVSVRAKLHNEIDFRQHIKCCKDFSKPESKQHKAR